MLDTGYLNLERTNVLWVIWVNESWVMSQWVNRSDQRFFIKFGIAEFQPKMTDKSSKRKVSEILVHLLRHIYFMPKGFEDYQILSQGIVLSDFSGLLVERNPFFSISTFHSLTLLLSKCNLHLKQHKRLDKRKHNSFELLTLNFLQSNTNYVRGIISSKLTVWARD